LLVSARAGCAPVLVPEPEGTTGARFDPLDPEAIANKLTWMAGLSIEDRTAMGRRAAETVSHWGPDRFALGFMEAVGRASGARDGRRARRRLERFREGEPPGEPFGASGSDGASPSQKLERSFRGIRGE